MYFIFFYINKQIVYSQLKYNDVTFERPGITTKLYLGYYKKP